MHSYEKQALSGAIEILSQSELPDRFEGMKLYGFSEEAKDELRQDCKIFRLSNETGHGKITVYQVFQVLSFTITICTWGIATKTKLPQKI